MGFKPILRNTTSLSALTLLVGSFDPQKTVPEMTYNVFSGTLNATHFTSLPVSYLQRAPLMFGRATIWLGILVLSILYWFRDWTPRLTSRKIDKQQARASID